MAKKYYWLKLSEGFFDEDTISFIEEQTNGIEYSNFYLKLCLKSLRNEGKLMRCVGEMMLPYDVDSLARLTRVPVDTVRSAMALFEQIGLVKRMDSGELFLTQMQELIGSETDKAQLMRRKRAEDRLENGNNVTEALPERDQSVTQRLEYRERDKSKSKSNTSNDVYREADKQDEDKAIYEGVKQAFNIDCPSLPECVELSDKRKKAIKACWKKYGPDKIREAFKMAEASEFLSGRSKKWKASFDWLMNTNNMLKVLEGNYINEKDNSKHTDTKGISRDIPSRITAMNGHEVDSL